MRTKELHFFDEEKYETNGWSWYEQHFAPQPGCRAYGEWTPEYIFNDLAFERISNDLGQVKIIAVFRNPIDRVYSHYWRYRSAGFTSLDFFDSLEQHAFFHERSRYSCAWEHYVDRFGANNCLPIIFERVKDDPTYGLQRVFRFLGVDDSFQPDVNQVRRNRQRFNRHQTAIDRLTDLKHKLRGHNMGWLVNCAKLLRVREGLALANMTRSKYPHRLSSPERHAVMHQYFRDDVKQFSRLINDDLSVWDC